MNRTLSPLTHGKPLRRVVCAAVALATTAVTIQVIISSAGVHEYGMAAMRPSPARSMPDGITPNDNSPQIRGSIVVARSR